MKRFLNVALIIVMFLSMAEMGWGANDFSTSKACWYFENNLNDSSGNSNTLTGYNSPAYESGSPLQGSYSLSLNGTNCAYRTDANLPTSFPFQSGGTVKTISLTAKVKLPSLPAHDQNMTIAGKYDGGTSARNFIFAINYDQYASKAYLNLLLGNSSGGYSETISWTPTVNIVANHTYLVGLTIDGTANKTYLMYIYDVDTSTATSTSGSISSTLGNLSAPFVVGAYSATAGYPLTGYIDQVVVFSELLTVTDYGNIVAETFGAVSPIVATGSVTAIAKTTATCAGTISDNGGGTIDNYGVVIALTATNPNPTYGGAGCTYFQAGTDNPSIPKSFTANITGLTAGSAYSVAACSHNEAGWGNDATPATFTSAQDYLVAQGGTAANKGNAIKVVSPTYPDNYMSVATHNGETFNPGDYIYLSDKGGDIKSSIIVPSSGESGSKIVYTAVSGETPIIDISVPDDGTGWVDQGSDIYKKTTLGTSILWKDGIPQVYQDTSSLTTGEFYSDLSSTWVKGNPAGHTYRSTMISSSNWTPYGIDLRSRSYLDISYITFQYGGGVGYDQNMNDTLVRDWGNIRIHHCTFNTVYWPFFIYIIKTIDPDTNVVRNIEVDHNTATNVNGGFSIWAGGAAIDADQTEYVDSANIHHNTINGLFSFASIDGVLVDWLDYVRKARVYPYQDHEGISLQNPVNCTIADNIVTTSVSTITNYGGDDISWVKPICIFTLSGNIIPITGNKVIRNRFTGNFTVGIEWAGKPETGGMGGNLFAMNYIKSSLAAAIGLRFNFYWTANILGTMNYILNNTVDLPLDGSSSNGIIFDGKNTDISQFTISNNIIIARRGIYTYTADTSYFVIDHNNYYCPTSFSGGYYWPFSLNSSSETIQTWRGHGWDTLVGGSHTDLEGDSNPILRYDGRITTISPTHIKSGGNDVTVNLAAFGESPIDALGTSYNPAGWEMGAYAESVFPGGRDIGMDMGVNGQMPPWMMER